MIPILLLTLVVVVFVTTLLSALEMALLNVSESALEDRLRSRGKDSSAVWLAKRRNAVEHGIALIRTFGRLATVVIVLQMIHDEAAGPTILDWEEIVLAIAVAGAIVWLSGSVLSSAIARHAGVSLVARLLPLLKIVYLLTLPVVWVGHLVDSAVKRLTGAETGSEQAEQELLHTIEDSARAGGLDRHSAQIMRNAVEFRDTVVSEIMTPRTRVEGIEYSDDLAVIREFISHAGHSRIPVYRGSLDETAGVLYVKDLIEYLGTGATGFELAPLLRHPLRVPESKRVSELLRDFQHSEVHLAMVVDEFGGTAGLVTIEDVLEEIVGEIYDEHEPESDVPPTIAGSAAEGWVVDGRVPLSDLARETGLDLPTDVDYDTVAGLALAHFGRVPTIGETFLAHGARFTIDTASLTRIAILRIVLAAP